MEQDFATKTESTSANLDLDSLGEFAKDNEYQTIDINSLENYWQGVEPTNPYFKEIKRMHVELIDLVKEDGFLLRIAEARKELKENDLRHQPDEADEDILPSKY